LDVLRYCYADAENGEAEGGEHEGRFAALQFGERRPYLDVSSINVGPRSGFP
jgi:hypothetical protein